MNKFISFINAGIAFIHAYMEREKQLTCRHEWKPARTSKGPAKHCEECNLTEHLTEAMYYAQFGKMPHKWY